MNHGATPSCKEANEVILADMGGCIMCINSLELCLIISYVHEASLENIFRKVSLPYILV